MPQQIINAACERSFGRSFPAWHPDLPPRSISVFAGGNGILSTPGFKPAEKSKIIVFGQPGSECASGLGLALDESLPPLAGKDACPVCQAGVHHTESEAAITWADHPLVKNIHPSLAERPFARFDFTNEWNNMGFGRVATGDGIWGCQGQIRANGARELAGIILRKPGGERIHAGAYMTLLDLPEASILWCQRPAGPVDSVEWSVIENFIASWRPDDLPCWPCLRQTPQGIQALATMRLDCDEDIASARDVFEFYASEGLPFSLAVKTSLAMRPEDLQMLRDVHASGGSLLSHSHGHSQNWGADYNAAFADARSSIEWFEKNLPEKGAPKNAVSPFHTNPDYAVRAIEDAGFTGMVGGIIHNDPECLLGRAGKLPIGRGKLASISQQSMLHGDCFAAQGNVQTHFDAFMAQYAANGIFGYLDHPFSERYQYGWESKGQRLAAHRELIGKIRQMPGVAFWSQDHCLDYVQLLKGIKFQINGDKVDIESQRPIGEDKPAYVWKGDEYVI